MGKEIFPVVKPGDTLTAQHVNRLSDVARRVISYGASGGLMASGAGFTAPPPSVMRYVIVTRKLTPEPVPEDSSASSSSSSSSSGSDTHGWDCETAEYQCQPRYFDFDDGEWKTDEEENEYCLDDSEFGNTLSVGDVVEARWDVQRGMFVRTSGSGGTDFTLRWGRAKEDKLAYQETKVNVFTGQPSKSGVTVTEVDTDEEISCLPTQRVFEHVPGFIVPLQSLGGLESGEAYHAFIPFSNCYVGTALVDWEAGANTQFVIGGEYLISGTEITVHSPWVDGLARGGSYGIIIPVNSLQHGFQFIPLSCVPILDPENLESSSASSS